MISLQGIGIPPSIANLIQDRTLERVFHDALLPNFLWRLEAEPEKWVANIGETQVFTRAGLITPNPTPLVPGTDPTPKSYATEQWEAEANQLGDAIDTHMPSDYVALASLFLRNTKTLGINGGQTMNRLARNRLLAAYLSGEAMVATAAVAGSVNVRVSTINGFTQALVNGRLTPVSATAPIPVTFTTVGEPANNVIGAAPDDPSQPLGPGTLTFQVATTNPLALRDGIFAGTRARRLRVGGGATVDGLAGGNILTVDDVISAISRLRENNVPPCSDGFYHVHVPPQGEAELFRDNHWQRLHQSGAMGEAYRRLMINEFVDARWYRQTEDPKLGTVSSTVPVPGGAGGALVAPEIGGEITNADGLPIRRTVVIGGGVMKEKYIDESKYITEAGVQGKIGNFNIVNGGVQVMTQRIRFIMQAPKDRMQQVVPQAWSWSGDFPIPSDQTTGDEARFKRAVVIEHA